MLHRLAGEMTFGEWIREQLVEAGSAGVTVADLHKMRKDDQRVGYRTGTYNSFARYFHWFKQLGFVEPVRTEASHAKGTDLESLERPRHYYRISAKGRRALVDKWRDPIFTHLGLEPYLGRCKPYRVYKPTGKPRGRPSRLSDATSPK